MNKYQARLIISVMAAVIFTLSGTGLAVHYVGIWWGLAGFAMSAVISIIGLTASILDIILSDDTGEVE